MQGEGTLNGSCCEQESTNCTALALPQTNSTAVPKKAQDPGACEYEDYLYAEDDDSCCEVESLEDAELFQKSTHHCSRTSSMSLENESAPGGLRPSCHEGLSPKSNRQPAETNGPGTAALHLGPPCGSALPGTMFRLRFVGSVEVEEEVDAGKRSRRRPKKTMVEEAVSKIKVRPSDLCWSGILNSCPFLLCWRYILELWQGKSFCIFVFMCYFFFAWLVRFVFERGK